jgi:hypothetical protein
MVYDDGFSPISLKVHAAKAGQPMHGSTFGNKVGLLGAYIRFDLGYINEYGFGLY